MCKNREIEREWEEKWIEKRTKRSKCFWKGDVFSFDEMFSLARIFSVIHAVMFFLSCSLCMIFIFCCFAILSIRVRRLCCCSFCYVDCLYVRCFENSIQTPFDHTTTNVIFHNFVFFFFFLIWLFVFFLFGVSFSFAYSFNKYAQ